jgi:hypothetical protein
MAMTDSTNLNGAVLFSFKCITHLQWLKHPRRSASGDAKVAGFSAQRSMRHARQRTRDSKKGRRKPEARRSGKPEPLRPFGPLGVSPSGVDVVVGLMALSRCRRGRLQITGQRSCATQMTCRTVVVYPS